MEIQSDLRPQVNGKLKWKPECVFKSDLTCNSKVESRPSPESYSYSSTRPGVEAPFAPVGPLRLGYHKIIGSRGIQACEREKSKCGLDEVCIVDSVLIGSFKSVTETASDCPWLGCRSKCYSESKCGNQNNFLHNPVDLCLINILFRLCLRRHIYYTNIRLFSVWWPIISAFFNRYPLNANQLSERPKSAAFFILAAMRSLQRFPTLPMWVWPRSEALSDGMSPRELSKRPSFTSTPTCL